MSSVKKKDIPLTNSLTPMDLIMGLDNGQQIPHTENTQQETGIEADLTDVKEKQVVRKKASKEEALPDPTLEIRSNKLFYIKRKYIKLIEQNQLKEGFRYTNDYMEHIIEFYFSKNKPS